MPKPTPAQGIFILLLILALAVRLVAAAWWEQRLPEGQKFGFPDSESYWQLGQQIARGEPYEFGPRDYKIFRTPGYPTLLAGLFTLLGDTDPPLLWARALGALLGTITVGLVGGLAWLLFGGRTALLATLIAAFHPEAIAPSVFVLSEAPFCPLMMVQLIAWTLAVRATEHRGRWGWALGAGVAAGVATLVRPSWLLFTPFAIVAALVFDRRRAEQIAVALVMFLGLCLTMLPWWVRNYKVAGRFVPTSLQVGASLYDGLNPKADGGSDMRFVPVFEKEQDRADQAAGQPLPGLYEDRLDQRMAEASKTWAKTHPWRVLELAANKFARMWNIWPNAREFQSRSLGIVLAIGYVPLMLAAAYGALRTVGRGWPYLLCLVPAVYFTLLHMIFVSSIRYRQPALLTLMVLAAGGVALLLRWPETQTPTQTDHA